MVEDRKPLFSGMSDNELLGYGVPAEWLKDVKTATEDTLLLLTDYLPCRGFAGALEAGNGWRTPWIAALRACASGSLCS
jgi:hypothetical protein